MQSYPKDFYESNISISSFPLGNTLTVIIPIREYKLILRQNVFSVSLLSQIHLLSLTFVRRLLRPIVYIVRISR